MQSGSWEKGLMIRIAMLPEASESKTGGTLGQKILSDRFYGVMLLS